MLVLATACSTVPPLPSKCPAIKPTVEVPPREKRVVIEPSIEGMAAAILKLREIVEKLHDYKEAFDESWDDCP